MSVIFTAEGHVVYETCEALDAMVTQLQQQGRMDNGCNWTDGAGNPFSPGERMVHRDWNGLRIPFSFNYRNFDAPALLNDAAWAHIITSAFIDTPGTTIYNAEGVQETVNLYEWAEANTEYVDADGYWLSDYVPEYYDQFDTSPPPEVKERMRVKNAHRNAGLITDEYGSSNSPHLD